MLESGTKEALNMTGAKLSKSALAALYGIKKARCVKDFSKSAKVDIRTVQKMAKGGYVAIDKVKMVEAELKRREAELATPVQAIIRKVAENRGVTVDMVLIAKSLNRYGQYSDAEIAKYISAHLAYKETRLSYRQLAAELGYKTHTSVIDAIKRISDLMDTKPALRHEVLNIQKSL